MAHKKGINLPATTSEATNLQYATSLTASSIPSGIVIPFAGSSLPSGYVECNGSNYPVGISGSTYYNLYQAIGIKYGGSVGVNFNVPDLRAALPIGVDTSITALNDVAKSGGAFNHYHSTGTHTHNTLHDHNLSNHTHRYDHYHSLQNHSHNLASHGHGGNTHTHNIPGHSHGPNGLTTDYDSLGGHWHYLYERNAGLVGNGDPRPSNDLSNYQLPAARVASQGHSHTSVDGTIGSGTNADNGFTLDAAAPGVGGSSNSWGSNTTEGISYSDNGNNTSFISATSGLNNSLTSTSGATTDAGGGQNTTTNNAPYLIVRYIIKL